MNKFYEIKKQLQDFMDAVINSQIYGMVFYSAIAIIAFIAVILVVFFLIALLRR